MLDIVDKIAKENAVKKKKKGNMKWQKLDKNRILGLDELEEGIESSSQSKKKIPGPYARHDESLNSRANSNDEEDQEVQSRKDVRYVKFNEKNM
ncbi:hypothetical protein LIER_31214 [Lithospermum erythrorhizon]|uniref:Uncharacterized protein n=1 Tax=Lithospermum erythrorhizon TaxID=34254 RepID=A0AAV3RQ68_LITER